MKTGQLFLFLWLLSSTFNAHACECPASTLSLEEAGKYEIIFQGIVKSVKICDGLPGEAVFEVRELYKGNVTADFTVLFKCDDPCYLGFKEGEEWIIYTRYKQMTNAMMDWCSRSRKFFRHDKEDFYKVNFGTDYFEEVEFLRSNFGLHRVLAEKKNAAGNRNLLPNSSQMIITLLVSIGGIVLFYLLFRKFFK